MIDKIKNSFKVACLLMLCLLCASESMAITPKQEKVLAREFMKVAFNNFKMIKAPLITGYVEQIGKKILSVAGPQPFRFHFYVILEDEYNAFAGPAGNIFINSGLLAALESEDELAGIIGHEIAHATCRHISDMIERSKKTQMATLAGIVAGIFLGVGGATQAASAVTIGSVAAGNSIQLAYSRDNERQADQLGLHYLEAAGYSGWGMVHALKTIRGKTWFGSEQIPTYLKTHPASEERIISLSSWLESREPNQSQKIVKTYAFERFHAKLIAEYTDESLALKHFAGLLATAPDNPMYHYGYGLALARQNNRNEAIQQMKKALAKKAFDPYLLNDLGIIYFQDGQYEEALNIMQNTASAEPFNIEANYYLGRTLKELGRLPEATEVLELVLQKDPKYSSARYFLGEIYGKEGNLVDAHYNLGLYYKQKGQFDTAIFHLKRALKEIRDEKKKKKITDALQQVANHEREDSKSASPNPFYEWSK